MLVALIERASFAVLVRWLCCVWLSLFSIMAQADQATGVAWASSQIQPNGQLVTQPNAIALEFQAQSELISTFHTLNIAIPAALANRFDATVGETVEILARKIQAKQLAGTTDAAYLGQLVAYQNKDGGFGAAVGYASNAQDTAWALGALAAAPATRITYASATQQALAWMLAAQKPQGLWTIGAEENTVVLTAQVVQALQSYRQNPAVTAALSKARSWLLEQQAVQVWDDPLANAQGLLAVLPAMTNAASMQASVASLQSAQKPDGSWGGEIYLTALALRALSLSAQRTTDPDASGVRGRVIDANQSTPVSGVSIRLGSDGLTLATSDQQGYFFIQPLAAGEEKLIFEKKGYGKLTANIGLQKGMVLDLGIIKFSNIFALGNPNYASISGEALYTDDGFNYYPAYLATVLVDGQRRNTIDATGRYMVDALGGNFSLGFTYKDYMPVEVAVSAQGLEKVIFNPVFKKRNNLKNILTVEVKNQSNGAPVHNAVVMFNGMKKISDGQGVVEFFDRVQAGGNHFTVIAEGFDHQTMTFESEKPQPLRMPVALVPTQPGTVQTQLTGFITDAQTNMPIAGAKIDVLGTGNTTVSDHVGRYVINGAPDFYGSQKIRVKKSGYQSYEMKVQLAEGKNHQLSLSLQPYVNADAPIRLQIIVKDQQNDSAIPLAAITLSGANGLCCTNPDKPEITPTPDAAMP